MAPAAPLRIGSRWPWGLWPVSISLATYQTHLYVVGSSGNGKSKLLQHLLFQLITTGWGCGVIDPHSDLASDLLAQLYATGWLAHEANRQRVIFLDPARTDYLMPANVLNCAYTTPHQTAENIVEAFRRVWPETLAEAPRFAQILRNGLMVLIENKLSLAELEKLLTNRTYRATLLTTTTDAEAVAFFTDQYNRWGKDQILMAGSVLNKVSAFLFFPSVRRAFGAADNRLDLRRLMDDGQILIVDLGGLNGETQQLYGSLLVTLVEQAAMSRRTGQTRRPFFCMIDEFPFFCARDPKTLARILSEIRKFNCFVGLAHQGVSQLDARMRGALENAKLKFIFGTGRETAEALVKDLFMPDLQAVKHEVKDSKAQERTHPVFDPMLEQFERAIQTIQRLREREMWVKLPDREEVIKLKTPDVPDYHVTDAQLAQIKTALAQQVGRPVGELEHARGEPDALSSTDTAPAGSDFWFTDQERA
jgi:hypothetical protein